VKSLIALLELPTQRRLLLATIPADFADWLDYVAIISLIVFAWGQGPIALAALSLTLTLPYVLVGPILASWVDRTDIRLVLLLSNLGRGLLTLGLAFAPGFEVLLVLVAFRAIVDSAFTPAKQAAIQLATPKDLLMPANGLHQGVNQTSKILGPALGGLLMALVQPQSVFLINALLSLVAFAVLLGLKLPARTIPTETHEKFWARLTGGISEFRRNGRLATALIFAAAAHFIWFLYDTQIAFLNERLGYDTAVFGISIAASGLGGVICAVLAGGLKIEPRLLMALSALLSGPVTAALALAVVFSWPVPLPLYLATMALLGGSGVLMMVPYRAVVQKETPPDRIARVSAAGEAVTITAMMAAPFFGSLITAAWGVPAPFLIGGVMLLLLGLAGLAIALRR
jgi:predicted MFS family arabinose efflux permease